MKKIAIVSCNKWQGKINEDRLLQDSLTQNGYNAEIISWENKNLNYEEYTALILRSAWGYQNKYLEFKNWLKMIKEKNILLLNNPNIIMSNIRKDQQFELLSKNGIPFIETKFLYKLDDLFENIHKSRNEVLKPIISGSGENTFLIANDKQISLNNIIKIYKELLKCEDNGIMLQPYIEDIKNGEFACIYIDGINTHNMIRYPGIFSNKQKPIYLSTLPKNVKDLADRVSQLEEYLGYLYMRVDIVLHNNQPMIMEVELAEPDLLFKYISDEKVKTEAINQFSKKLIRRVNQ